MISGAASKSWQSRWTGDAPPGWRCEEWGSDEAAIKVTKGPGSRAAGLAMAFKLIESAQDRWRAVNSPHLVALVRAGAKFNKGVMIERPTQQDQEVAA